MAWYNESQLVGARHADYTLIEVHLLDEERPRLSSSKVRQLTKRRHVNTSLEDDEDMISIVIRDLLCILANIKTSRTMRASQPNASDLVRVDVAQSLPM